MNIKVSDIELDSSGRVLLSDKQLATIEDDFQSEIAAGIMASNGGCSNGGDCGGSHNAGCQNAEICVGSTNVSCTHLP